MLGNLFRRALVCVVVLSCVNAFASEDFENEFEPNAGPAIEQLNPIRIFADHMAQAFGFYTKGTLANAYEMPLQGSGVVKIFRSRRRGFATDEMAAVILNAGRILVQQFPRSERIQMADFSARHGGAISGHGSHQNGLDVDLIYLRVNNREMPVDSIGGMDEDFVRSGKLTRNFDIERNWFMVKNLTESGIIGRMFVDPVIKETFCRVYGREAQTDRLSRETLRRLRAWPNHANHVHVRLKCPVLSPKCAPQVDPDQGTGC